MMEPEFALTIVRRMAKKSDPLGDQRQPEQCDNWTIAIKPSLNAEH